MVFSSREMVVLSAAEGDTFRLCVTEEGGFLGRAYNREDVERIRDACGASTVRWAPGAMNFPGGENLDAVVDDLLQEAAASEAALIALKEAGGPAYVAELEHHAEVCARLHPRLQRLAHITP